MITRTQVPEWLLDELGRLATASKMDAFSLTVDIHRLPAKEQSLAHLFNQVLSNYKSVTRSELQQQDVLERILNSIDNYIHVSDLETDEILFINQKMDSALQLGESFRGQACWQLFQRGQTGRCPWCKKAELIKDPDAVFVWDELNSITGRNLYKIDRVIDWPDGRKVHLQQNIDITEIKKIQAALLRREEMLSCLNRAALALLSNKETPFEDVIAEGFGHIAGIAKIDRASILRNKEKPYGLRASQLYRWSKAANSTIPPLTELEIRTYDRRIPSWRETLSAGKCINGPVCLMPEGKELLEFGCLSMLALPVFHEGKLWGAVLFENLDEERAYTSDEVDILRSASLMLTNAVIQNEANQKIRATDQYAKMLLDATPLCCRLWDQNYDLIECNVAAAKLFGLDSKQEYIERFFELAPPMQPDGQRTYKKAIWMIEQAFKKGSYKDSFLYQMPDGSPLPAEVTLIRLSHQDRYVVASYSRDLREQEKILSEIKMRDRLLQTVNQAIDILLRADPDKFTATLHVCMGVLARSIDANRMYIASNHVRNGSLYFTQCYEWCGNVPPSGEQMANVSYDQVMPTLKETLQQGECIHSLTRDIPDTDRAWLETRGARIVLLIPVWTRGEFWGFVGFDECQSEHMAPPNVKAVMHSGCLLVVNTLLRNESILSLRDTSAQLEVALKDAKAANSAKSSFLAQMSHEIRTPLNAIVGFSELLLSGQAPTKELMATLDKIHTSGMTILNIVNDILDISKVESGNFKLSPIPYDIPSLINDIVSLNIVWIRNKPVTFRLFVDENLPGKLYGDALRIKQVFNNLLSNAFKYTLEGSVEWHVGFEWEGDSVWLVSWIRDTGIGIKRERIQQLFTDYYRVDETNIHDVEGTGLGLSITKQLAELMDGSISVESEFQKGTTFSVRLRQGFISDESIGKKTAGTLQKLQYSHSRGPRATRPEPLNLSYAHVLVVDDIDTNLDVAKGIMARYGLKADCVSSGPEAIERIQSGHPRYSAVFMDYMMPGMDGIEAARIIREEIGSEYAKNLPMIALTANAIEGTKEMFLDWGFQGFLSKPIDVAGLDAILRQWVWDENREERHVSEMGRQLTRHKPGRSILPPGTKASGIDLQGLLEHAGGDEAAMVNILHSYTMDTQRLLRDMEGYLAAGKLSDYEIAAHGIKGASNVICAPETGLLAEALEQDAKAGHLAALKAGHPAFVQAVRALLGQIDAVLGAVDAAASKPSAAWPDPLLLHELQDACSESDMNRVEAAMERLGSFRYEQGEELVGWLREKVNDIAYEEIANMAIPDFAGP